VLLVDHDDSLRRALLAEGVAERGACDAEAGKQVPLERMSSSSRAIGGKRAMILLRTLAGTLLALSLAGPATGQQGGTDGQRFAGELMRHLGLDPAGRLIELENGAVVHNGVPSQEKLADEVAAAGSMLLVRGREASAVIDAFLHTETFLQVHKVKRQQAVEPNAGDGPAFASLPFPGSESVAELVKAPRRSLNLSVAEGERLSRLDLAAPDLAGRARAAFAEILAARLRSYATRGVAGVEAYVREGGQVVEPRVELRTALASLAVVQREFPGFLDRLGAGGSDVTYYWMERSVERVIVLILSAELRTRGATAALGADLHFYAAREYNSMLTVIGVIPYTDASLVFAVNHTFTDRVTGMGSTVRRTVARNRIASELARHLDETRKRLAR